METEIKYRGFGIEFRAMLSDEPSYFSKKRFESLSIFIAVLISYVVYMIVNIRSMEAMEFVEVSGAMMVYGGYTVSQIQKEKRDENK